MAVNADGPGKELPKSLVKQYQAHLDSPEDQEIKESLVKGLAKADQDLAALHQVQKATLDMKESVSPKCDAHKWTNLEHICAQKISDFCNTILEIITGSKTSSAAKPVLT